MLTHPNVKFHILISDGLDIEAHGGDSIHRLSQLQLVQDGRLAGSVQAQHQDPHLLVPKHLGQNLPHGGGGNGSQGSPRNTAGENEARIRHPLFKLIGHTIRQDNLLMLYIRIPD